MLISIDTEHLDTILANLMILTFLWPLQDEIEKVMETQEKLQKDVNKLKGGVKNIREQTARLEGMLRCLLENSGVGDYKEEDFQDGD